MRSTGLANHFSWNQGSSYTLAAEHLRWEILSWILLPTYCLTRAKSQVDTIISSISARCKKVVLQGNEGFIIGDVFTVTDFCLGRRRTNDVQVHQEHADFNSTYGTASMELYLSMVVAVFPPWWKLQCSVANYPCNFLLLSQAILESSPGCYWILETCCLIENYIDPSSQNVVSCLSCLLDRCPRSLNTTLATNVLIAWSAFSLA